MGQAQYVHTGTTSEPTRGYHSGDGPEAAGYASTDMGRGTYDAGPRAVVVSRQVG